MPSDVCVRSGEPTSSRAERQIAAHKRAHRAWRTADLFPRFSLTGSLGLQSEKFKDLGNSESIFYNYGPGVTWNIFNAGKFRSNIAVQNAREEQQVVIYQQTVLNSLEKWRTR